MNRGDSVTLQRYPVSDGLIQAVDFRTSERVEKLYITKNLVLPDLYNFHFNSSGLRIQEFSNTFELIVLKALQYSDVRPHKNN